MKHKNIYNLKTVITVNNNSLWDPKKEVVVQRWSFIEVILRQLTAFGRDSTW
jgi:hypothetical protein